MRSFLLATTILAFPLAAHAQSCSPAPAPAAAAGFTTQTFGGPLTLGQNAFPFSYDGINPGATGVSQGANGINIPGGGGDGWNAQLALSTPSGAGTTFGGGGYFEATLSFAGGTPGGGGGWPSFWANTAEGMVNGGQNIEVDQMEFDTGQNTFGSGMHDWLAGGGQVSTTGDVPQAIPPGTDLSQPHRYGLLIVPATATTQGYARYYFDGIPGPNTTTWGTSGTYSMLDSAHLAFIFGTGANNPMTVYGVNVWQASASGDQGPTTSCSASTSAASSTPSVSPAAVSAAPSATASTTPDVKVADAGVNLAQRLLGESKPNTALIQSLLADANTQLQQTVPTTTTATTEITPGNGSLTDCSGNVWTISQSGSIMEGNTYTPGGGQTDALTISGCTVYGHDSTGRGWFTLSSNNASGDQYWSNSSAPPGVITPASPPVAQTTSPPPTTTTLPTPTSECNAAAPNFAASSGGFGTVDGQIYSPNGTPFIARGINVYDFDANGAAAAIPSTFPGVNFIRLNITSYQDPSAYKAFIAQMTAQGIVVELEDHPDGGGGQDAPFTGTQLATESAWYASVAAAFKNNPYVWFGTFNEPGTSPGSLSQWQLATYNAIRSAGNNNPIMLEIAGYPGAWDTMLDRSVYAGMTNVIWDAHYYGWISNYSTDQATVTAALAAEVSQVQQIQSADGKMPVILGEFGDSTNGASRDANWSQVIKAVTSSGLGSAAWNWSSYGGSDALRNGNSLSDYGQMVAKSIASGGAGPNCAQSPIPNPVFQSEAKNGLTVNQVAALAAKGGVAPNTPAAWPAMNPDPVVRSTTP